VQFGQSLAMRPVSGNDIGDESSLGVCTNLLWNASIDSNRCTTASGVYQQNNPISMGGNRNVSWLQASVDRDHIINWRRPLTTDMNVTAVATDAPVTISNE
jgi:hypothetical protein